MPIICLWPNDHLCTVWGSIIFVVSEEMILIQFPIRTYAMQCPVVIAILDFLPGKNLHKKTSVHDQPCDYSHIVEEAQSSCIFSECIFA